MARSSFYNAAPILRLFGWEELPTGKSYVQEVPGFRQNMFDEPHVKMLESVIEKGHKQL
jgi:hypothetical protein